MMTATMGTRGQGELDERAGGADRVTAPDGLEDRPNIQSAIDPGGASQNRIALMFALKTMTGF